MSARHIHVIGAGMAGLAAALQLSFMGEQVTLYEAAPFGGGRCRSYFDQELGCRLDNGNHLVLSGNVAIQDYLYLSGALDSMTGPPAPDFPFMDLETGRRWITRMNEGPIPWWILNKNRRVAGTRIKDYLSALPIMMAGHTATVAAKLDMQNALYRRFWEPLTIAALNTEPEIASARLLANIFRQTFGIGGHACHPLMPKVGLSESFVVPCLDVLRARGVILKFNHRLRPIEMPASKGKDSRIRELHFGKSEVIPLGSQDWAVLAVPAWVARELLPGLSTPTEFRSIINAHYRVEAPHNPAGLTGLIGGMAEWVFVKPEVVSVTVSAGERYVEHAVRDMAKMVWRDVAKLFDLDPVKVPPHRIFKEKFATFAATPEQDARRPSAFDFRWRNLALAGEWTATGLPSTIEGAIRSGFKAAQVVSRWGD
jgi:squalene-associated FAD-dependent desaturase